MDGWLGGWVGGGTGLWIAYSNAKFQTLATSHPESNRAVRADS